MVTTDANEVLFVRDNGKKVTAKDYVNSFFQNNRIKPGEARYYAGKTGKHPHGIHDSIWASVRRRK